LFYPKSGDFEFSSVGVSTIQSRSCSVKVATLYLKFEFSKKTTKINQIFTVELTLVAYNVKSTVKISSTLVAFLENMNFNCENQNFKDGFKLLMSKSGEFSSSSAMSIVEIVEKSTAFLVILIWEGQPERPDSTSASNSITSFPPV
jgi:hypothetical protein